MRLPRKMTSGFVPWQEWNALLEWIENALKITVGGGLEMTRTASGTTLRATGKDSQGPQADMARMVLDSSQNSQDTDYWETGLAYSGSEMLESGSPTVVGEPMGCAVKLITDIAYDGATGILSYRTRTLRIDPYGRIVAVVAEDSAPITITTAVGCP